jgi:hypothetical protein|tara:strand:+ start:141 stop:548 length:408 start_codon:yes stop_codon:yes gene_type:complete
MNELEKQLSELVKKGIEVAEQTGNFVIDQAPLLLQEFFSWHILSYVLGISLGISIFLIGRYLPYLWLSEESTGTYSVKFFKKWNTGDNISKDPSASWIIFALTTIASVIIICVNTYYLMYILVAPKLYLIDYFIR